jgi:hypothetical protein
MRTRRLVVIGAVGAIAAAGCYPNDDVTSVSDFASVTTLVDSQAPLRAARTFALPDTVIHTTLGDGTATTTSHAGDAQILDRIRAGFIDFGWREITDVRATRADVVILTAVLEREQTGVAYGSWWGDWGYWPGWPASYGGYGWGYPGAAVEFTYETGTLLITMLDLLHGDASTKRVPLLWAAGINGVLTSSSLDGALDGITQAFIQSPYLERP